MPARKLIETLARAEAALRGQHFLAPLSDTRQARLRIGGLVHTLDVDAPAPGWWLCRALDTRHAQVSGPALPWQRGDYLSLWPALRLVLLEPLQGNKWLALPFNPSDAAQRFHIHGPIAVHLVEQGQPFARVLGRVEGRSIWYDAPDRRGDSSTAEALRAALATGNETPEIAGLAPGEQAAYALLLNRRILNDRAFAARRTERRLQTALELGGAKLIAYQMIDGNLRVTWERASQRHITLVNDQLEVISAGICLSGHDHHFDLTSVIGVIDEAPDFARWDE